MNGHPRWTNTVREVPAHLNDPLRWKRPRRIFVNSMSDLFHEQVSDTVLRDVFSVMQRANWHTFQVLTKRPERMAAFVPTLLHEGWNLPAHIWCGTSIELQAYVTDRCDALCRTPATVRFLSLEPLLGPLDLYPWLVQESGLPCISWVIVGGESGLSHRPMELAWLESIADQCRDARVPLFVKQDSGRFPGQWGRIPEGLRIREWPDLAVPA